MNFFLAQEYFKYFHLKTDEHSLHSPFFYHFYLKLIKSSSISNDCKSIEENRAALLKDETEFVIKDLGAGSKVNQSKSRTVKSIARHSLSNPKFSQFLYRIIQHFNFESIIELGTSLGINTAYMAQANPDASVFTFEADPNALKIAREVNKEHKNINFHEGDIANSLPNMLQKSNPTIDLVYADANHTYQASVDYFNIILPHLTSGSIYIMDDIHWSAGMKKAWEELKERKEVTSSIDLFDAGLLFFNSDFKKQHHVLDF
ncbi:O-methyltransferase [Marivirga tractuosa]|uniref:O-methyltransferase-like protein n=1 Tax=Marivirga tractuosa (strain ATCC 23168 / DSM 4126 / NBRC 15989 / NCIMB 1408 / VKM B-1430 / H-43) TaxID=643867 RepID=E4TM05_MARTH|nr:class I SAM-dependent methyltransferase [Marivirga tractuosa]ADR20296.1 O-methyltransferase-like protein [Marivirga tractuosa DSM 4126]BDD15262.1 O-methyltransferase [Marivirga tractuosa]